MRWYVAQELTTLLVHYLQKLRVKVYLNTFTDNVQFVIEKLEGAVPIMGTHSTGIDLTAISPDP